MNTLTGNPISANEKLKQTLNKRLSENALRSLRSNSNLIDFCSNDYLGLSRSSTLNKFISDFILDQKLISNGSTGSRLISGNSSFIEQTEKKIATFHKAEAALIFNSGYDANLGLFSCVPKRGDSIIYDELIHASIHDGMRLSYAERYSFKHNDLHHLEAQLTKASGIKYVAVESIYSMDGDTAPLKEISAICEKHNAHLIIDEAHATGIRGTNGEGLVNELNIEDKVFARIHTFGKALGVHGAAVVGSTVLRDYLINFSRSFIYTTALPAHSIAAIHCAYEMLPGLNKERSALHEHIQLFKDHVRSFEMINSYSPIQCLIYPGNENAKGLADFIRQKGFDVRPILSPTVSENKERLRICIHSFNTTQEITNLANALNSFKV